MSQNHGFWWTNKIRKNSDFESVCLKKYKVDASFLFKIRKNCLLNDLNRTILTSISLNLKSELEKFENKKKTSEIDGFNMIKLKY